MESVMALVLVIAFGIVGLLIFLWSILELSDFLKWVFPTNKEDEAGPFRKE